VRPISFEILYSKQSTILFVFRLCVFVFIFIFPRHLDPNKKATHNQLEKKRRDEMKTDFDDLRYSLPGFEGPELIPKITVLLSADERITKLMRREKELEARLQLARKDHEILRQRLVQIEKKS